MRIQPSPKSFSGFLFLVFLLLTSATTQAQTLGVTPGISTLTVYPGQGAATLPVSVSLGASGAQVSVTVTGLPDGISVAPLAVTSSGTTQVTLNVGIHAGNTLYNVTGSNGNAGISQVSAPVTVVVTDGVTTASASVTLSISISNPNYAPAEGDHDLPIVRINTSGVGIVDKETSVPGTITITSADGATSYLPGTASTDNTATFKVHGNTTSVLPKLPYKVKLNTSADLLTAMGMKCGYVTGSGAAVCDKSKSYILLANFLDKSMLRNWAAAELARAIPNGGAYLASASGSPSPSGNSTIMPWSPHSLFVDVYLNGVYEGVYELIEEVKIDSHRVNINEMAQTDLTGNALTGGYLMEFNLYADETTNFSVPHATWGISLEDPDFDVVIPQQANYISSYVASADAALFSSDYTNLEAGWRAYFDVAALTNYYMVEDLTGNWDSARLAGSAYLYKDKKNPLLYFGPVWDADVSAGNAYQTPILDPTIPWMQTYSPWFQQFFSDAAFKTTVATQWNTLKANGVFDTWLSSLTTEAATLKNGFARNNNRWPMLGIPYWVSGNTYDTYDSEVGYLVAWLEARMGYLNNGFNPNRAASAVGITPGDALTNDTPSTLTATVSPSDATGDVVFRCNGIVLGHAPLVAETAVYTGLLPGYTTNVDAIYVGDKTYLASDSGYLNVAVRPSKKPSTTILSALLGTHRLVPGTANALAVSVLGNTASTVATGTISLLFNGTAVASAPLVNGTASIAVPVLATGRYSVVARYSGDTTYTTSDSASLALSVSATTASFSLSTPASEVAGTPFSLTVTAKDAGGHLASDYDGTVHLASTDAAAVLPLDSGLTDGTLSFPLTLNTPGTQTVTVTGISPDVPAASAQVTVAAVAPVITFSIPDHAYGDADFAPAATSTSDAAIQYSVVSGPATIVAGKVHLASPGIVVVQMDQAAKGIFAAASQTASFVVNKATPTIVWHPGAITYGAAFDIKQLNATATGADGLALSGSFAYTPAAGVVPTTTPVTLSLLFTPADTINYLPATASTSLALTPAALTVSANDATRVYGVANPAFAGTVAGQQNGDTFAESFATTATTLSTAGTYAIVPTAAGANLSLYQVTVHNGTLTVSKAPTAITLALSKQAIDVGQTLGLTAALTTTSAGTPTGSIQFLDNGVALGTVALTGSGATLNLTTLGPGAHVLSAVYAGDTNFATSTSSTTSGTITVTAPDFTLQPSATSSSLTVSTGNPAVISLQLTPADGTFPAVVALTDSGNLPGNVKGVFSQTALATGSGTTTVTYTITKSATGNVVGITAAGLLLPLLLGWRRKKFRGGILLAAMLLLGGVSTAALSGCGSAAAGPQNVTLTLTATSLGITHSQVFTVTVQ